MYLFITFLSEKLKKKHIKLSKVLISPNFHMFDFLILLSHFYLSNLSVSFKFVTFCHTQTYPETIKIVISNQDN